MTLTRTPAAADEDLDLESGSHYVDVSDGHDSKPAEDGGALEPRPSSLRHLSGGACMRSFNNLPRALPLVGRLCVCPRSQPERGRVGMRISSRRRPLPRQSFVGGGWWVVEVEEMMRVGACGPAEFRVL